MSKYERAIRYGRLAKDSATLGFPNFFAAQKVRAKITQADEKSGNISLLGMGEKKPTKTKQKP
jgi:hypothetical protein